jgi:hypothetical protein
MSLTISGLPPTSGTASSITLKSHFPTPVIRPAFTGPVTSKNPKNKWVILIIDIFQMKIDTPKHNNVH